MRTRRLAAATAVVFFLLIAASSALASDPAVERLIVRQDALADAGDDKTLLEEANARLLEADSAVNRYLLGRAYGMTGELDKAREQFNWALERDPANAYAYHGIGAYFLMKRDLDEAERYLKNAIRLDAKLTRAHLELGKLFLTRQDRLAAQREFLAVLAYEPDNIDVRIYLAYQYLRDKRWERAGQEFVVVLSKDDKHAGARKGLAIALAYQKRTDEAIKEFEKVLEVAPKDLDAYLYLTNLLVGKGRKEEAIAVLEKLLAVVPEKSSIAVSARQEIENIREGRTSSRKAVTIPLMIERLDSKNVEERREAMARLVELGIKPPHKRMVRAVMDEDPVVRTLAVRNLGNVGGRFVVALIEVLLRHPQDAEKNERVRGAAVRSLGRIGDPSGVPVILAVFEEEDLYVFNLCLESLRDLSGRSFVDDPARPVTAEKKAALVAKWRAWWGGPRSFSKKLHAIEAIEEIDTRRMAAYLVELLGDEEQVSAKARVAFRKVTGVSIGTPEDPKTEEGRKRLVKEAAIALAAVKPAKKPAKGPAKGPAKKAD
jgi:tetratricopeptide (TPR) repeat protein